MEKEWSPNSGLAFTGAIAVKGILVQAAHGVRTAELPSKDRHNIWG